MDTQVQVLFTGIGATALMDVAMVARERFLGIPQPDYGFFGRWLCRMAHGQYPHPRIAAAPAHHERCGRRARTLPRHRERCGAGT